MYGRFFSGGKPKKMAQGRIQIKSPDTQALFRMYDRIPVNQTITGRELIDSIWEPTPLTDAFFSAANCLILQNGIRAGVFRASKEQYVIDPVDANALSQIMSSVFLQRAQHTPASYRQQMEDMNREVVSIAVHHCYGEAQGYLNYRKDVGTLAVPLEHPVLLNTKDKQLEHPGWSRYTGVTNPTSDSL